MVAGSTDCANGCRSERVFPTYSKGVNQQHYYWYGHERIHAVQQKQTVEWRNKQDDKRNQQRRPEK